MFKRIYNSFRAILSLFCFICAVSGCSMIEENKCSEPGIYVTFTFDFGDIMTKTSGSPHNAETYESYIKDLSIYLVRINGSGYIKIDGKDAGWNPETKKTGLIRLDSDKAGKYHVYVVANSANSFTYQNSDINDLLSAQVHLSENQCRQLWGNNHFAMSNANDTFNLDFMQDAELIVGQHTEASPLNLKISLDRLACKVVASVSDDCGIPFENLAVYGSESTYYVDSFEATGVALINCANSFNLYQHWEKGKNWVSGGTPDGYPEMRLVSPGSAKSYNMESGYYNKWSDYVSASLELNKAIEFSPMGTPLYCLENNSPYYNSELAGASYNPNHDAGTKMKGRTTGVVFRVQVLFKEGLYLTENLNHDPVEHDWGTYTDPLTKGNSTPAPITFYQYKSHYFADATKLLSTYPELGTDKTTSVLRQKGVSVFEDGQMYYIHWIMDDNYKDGGNGYYSVIRNSYYNLTVTDINSIGDDIPGGHDFNENDPIDLKDKSLTAMLSISNWTDKDINLTL